MALRRCREAERTQRVRTATKMALVSCFVCLHVHFRKKRISEFIFNSNSAFLFLLQDSGRPVGSLSRDFTLSRVVFSCMQGVASTPIHKSVKTQCQTSGGQNTSRPSRFQQFHEVKTAVCVQG